MLHQGDLLKKFNGSNLSKVNFLKLLTKENLLECFHYLTTFQQQRRIHQNFVEKITCKQSGLLTITITSKKVSRNTVDILTKENYIEKSMWKQRGFFDYRNYIEKSTWKQRGFFDHQNYIKESTWKQRGFFNHRNYIEKSTWKQHGFFDHGNCVKKTTWKRCGFLDQQNYIEKVRVSDVEIR